MIHLSIKLSLSIQPGMSHDTEHCISIFTYTHTCEDLMQFDRRDNRPHVIIKVLSLECQTDLHAAQLDRIEMYVLALVVIHL